MNLEVYSKSSLLNEIVNEVSKKQIFPWKDKDYIIIKLKNIFISLLQQFIRNWFNNIEGEKNSWIYVKKLSDNVYELREKLNEKNLIRIIFYFEKDKIILSTWYIIKDNKWDYKKWEEETINLLYKKEILNAYETFKDFKNDIKKLKYIYLTNYFK